MADVPPPEPPSGGGDDAAQKEKAFFEQKAPAPDLADHQRKFLGEITDLRKALFWAARVFVRSVGVLLTLAVGIWWWHMVGPDKWRWLSPDEVNRLQSIILSGAVSALVATIGRKLMPLE